MLPIEQCVVLDEAHRKADVRLLCVEVHKTTGRTMSGSNIAFETFKEVEANGESFYQEGCAARDSTSYSKKQN